MISINTEQMNDIEVYKSAEFLLDNGFESNQNSYLSEFPEISQNNSQHLISDFIFPKINQDTLPLEEEDYNALFFIKPPDFQDKKKEKENKENAFTKGKIISKNNENSIAKQFKLENEKNELFNCNRNTNQNSDNISNLKSHPIKVLKDSYSNKNSSKNQQPRKYFRVDDAKKHFKVAISQFATEEINSLIKNSDLSKRFKKKIHAPNFKLFTSNPKEFDNFQFLNFDLKTVFTFGKTQINLQGRNYENIINILNSKNQEKVKKIKDYLFLKYEDIIKLFYKSEKFKEFKENDVTKFFEEGIKKEKNISLLEDEGLIKLFQMTKKKRKRELFSLNKI